MWIIAALKVVTKWLHWGMPLQAETNAISHPQSVRNCNFLLWLDCGIYSWPLVKASRTLSSNPLGFSRARLKMGCHCGQFEPQMGEMHHVTKKYRSTSMFLSSCLLTASRSLSALSFPWTTAQHLCLPSCQEIYNARSQPHLSHHLVQTWFNINILYTLRIPETSWNPVKVLLKVIDHHH